MHNNPANSASVPFKFDIHALIFSYEAYQLEADLHNYFDNYRVNKINHRKEFFKVPIDKIENKLEEYKNLTIDFNRKPDAEEYYQSISIEEKIL
ncbi:GIY-YIG nuclease family protein [Enterococcus hirae]